MKHLMHLVLPLLLISAAIVPTGSSDKTRRDHTTAYTEPFGTLYNINRISGWIYADGTSGNAPNGDAGIIFPRGTASIVYQDGIVWGGYVHDNNPQNPRVGGQAYQSGTQPGPILTAGDSLNPPISSNPYDQRFHIYRIRRDYQTMSDEEVRADASELLLKDTSDVTPTEMEAVRSRYAADWAEWPADLGAPFYDINGNGIFEPDQGEEPGLLGADQVIWFVCNDLNPDLTGGYWGSNPMGIELQVTVWAYKDSLLQDVVYRRYRLINKSGFDMDEMYIGLWSDTDIGHYTDDLAGCDSMLGVSYCYNGTLIDADFAQFDISPPASGNTLLQGPILSSAGDTAFFNFKKLSDYKNIRMSSHAYYASGSSSLQDPGDYSYSLEIYNELRGFLPVDILTNPPSWRVGSGPDNGKPTKFPLSGDPVSGFGDVDGEEDNLGPGDRTTMINSGPFTIANGDTQEVVFALVGGIDPGGDYLSAITDMKGKIPYLHENYPVAKKHITTSAEITGQDGMNSGLRIQVDASQFSQTQIVSVRLTPEAGSEPDTLFELNDAGQNGDVSPGDHIWTAQINIANRQYPFKGDIILSDGNGTTRFDSELQYLRLRPPPELINFKVVWENSAQDQAPNPGESIQLKFTVHNTDLRNPITMFRLYEAAPVGKFPVNFAALSDTIPPGGTVTAEDIYLPLQMPATGDSVSFERRITFDYHSFFGYWQLPITPWTQPIAWHDTLSVKTMSGYPGKVFPVIADPDQLTGHLYRVSFIHDAVAVWYDSSFLWWDSVYLWDLEDLTAGEIRIARHQVYGTVPEPSPPVVDGIIWNIIQPPADFHAFEVVANGGGSLDPPEQGVLAINNNGFPLVNGRDRPDPTRQQTNGSTWVLQQNNAKFSNYSQFKSTTTQYTGGLGEANQGIAYLFPRDYEIRFTGTQGPGFFRWPYLDTAHPAFMGTVPFELWCLGDDPGDPGDDYQCLPWINDVDSNGVFNLLAQDHTVSDGDDDPFTDTFYWIEPLHRTTQGFADLVAAHEADPAGASAEVLWAYKTDYAPWFCVAGMMRMVFVNWNGGSVSDPSFPANVDAQMPEPGTIFRIVTNKPIAATDTFEINSDLTGLGPQELPLTFELMQNYPNPFNLSTMIRFSLPVASDVRLDIYNILGQKVATLADRRYDRGRYTLRWEGLNQNGMPVSSGMYIYRITAGSFISSRKMLLVK